MLKRIILIFLLFATLGQIVYCDDWDVWKPYQAKDWNFHIHTSNSQSAWYELYSLGYAIYTCFGSIDHITALSPEKTIAKCVSDLIHVAITDHSFKMTQSDLDKQISLCKKTNFLCIIGQEITFLDNNHIILLNHNKVLSTVKNNKGIEYVLNIQQFMQFLMTHPYAICIICHPLYITSIEEIDYTINPSNYPLKNWNNYRDLKRNRCFCLMELNSKLPKYLGIKYHINQYIQALIAGMYVGPCIAEDCFGPPSKNTKIKHTVVYTLSDSEEGLYDSIRKHLVYATEDENFILKFMGKNINKNIWHLMGDEIVCKSKDKISLKLWLQDPNEQIGQVQIVAVTNDNAIIIFSKQCSVKDCKLDCTVTINSKNIICYFVKVIQPDENMIVSAPIWVRSTDPEPISYADLPPSALPQPEPTQPNNPSPFLATKYIYEKGLMDNVEFHSFSVHRGNCAMAFSLGLYFAKAGEDKAQFFRQIKDIQIQSLYFAQLVGPDVVVMGVTYTKGGQWFYNRLLKYHISTNYIKDIGACEEFKANTCLNGFSQIIISANKYDNSYCQIADSDGEALQRLNFNKRHADIACDRNLNIYVLFNSDNTHPDPWIEVYDKKMKFIKYIKIQKLDKKLIQTHIWVHPISIATDIRDNIYILWWNGYLQKFDHNMNLICGFSVPANCYQVRVDWDGRIYVSGRLHRGVYIYKPID